MRLLLINKLPTLRHFTVQKLSTPRTLHRTAPTNILARRHQSSLCIRRLSKYPKYLTYPNLTPFTHHISCRPISSRSNNPNSQPSKHPSDSKGPINPTSAQSITSLRPSAGSDVFGAISAYRAVTFLRDLSRLGVLDLIPTDPNSSISAGEIATKLDLNEDALYRILRFIASFGWTCENADKTFCHTNLSIQYVSASPLQSMLFWQAGNTVTQCNNNTEYILRTGEDNFSATHGSVPLVWMRDHPNVLTHFAKYTEELSQRTLDVLPKKYDFSKINRVADIGGSLGHLLVGIIESNPHVHCILFEVAQVIDIAKKNMNKYGIDKNRIEFVEGDFFKVIDVDADIYLLKHIMHDWSDEQCAKILNNIAKQGAVSNNNNKKRALVIEAVVDPNNRNEFDLAKAYDVLKLTVTGGRERTLDEFDNVFRKGGFRRVGEPRDFALGFSIIEIEMI